MSKFDSLFAIVIEIYPNTSFLIPITWAMKHGATVPVKEVSGDFYRALLQRHTTTSRVLAPFETPKSRNHTRVGGGQAIHVSVCSCNPPWNCH